MWCTKMNTKLWLSRLQVNSTDLTIECAATTRCAKPLIRASPSAILNLKKEGGMIPE